VAHGTFVGLKKGDSMHTASVNDTESKSVIMFEVDGRAINARVGDTVASALLTAGIQPFRRTRSAAPRSVFCGMGVCYDCAVTIDGLRSVRACMTRVRNGMKVETK